MPRAAAHRVVDAGPLAWRPRARAPSPGLVGKDGRVTTLALERSYHVATLDYDLDLLVERSAAFVDDVAAAQSRHGSDGTAQA